MSKWPIVLPVVLSTGKPVMKRSLVSVADPELSRALQLTPGCTPGTPVGASAALGAGERGLAFGCPHSRLGVLSLLCFRSLEHTALLVHSGNEVFSWQQILVFS